MESPLHLRHRQRSPLPPFGRCQAPTVRLKQASQSPFRTPLLAPSSITRQTERRRRLLQPNTRIRSRSHRQPRSWRSPRHAAFSQSAAASGTYTLTPPGNGPTVSIVVTTDDQTKQLALQSAVNFSAANGGSNVVYVDETQVYQGIEGFGAATTDSAMYLLNEVAKPSQPAQFTSAMNNLFTRQGGGIGISFLRNPMGASDLARSVYSFDDNNGQCRTQRSRIFRSRTTRRTSSRSSSKPNSSTRNSRSWPIPGALRAG